MADPNTPIMQDVVATQAATDANNAYVVSQDAVVKQHERISNSVNIAATNLNSFTDQTSLSAKGLGVLTAVAIGTNDAFANFGNVDSSKIATFGKSIDELTANLTRSGTAAGDVSHGIASLRGVIDRMGGSEDGFKKMFGSAASLAT